MCLKLKSHWRLCVNFPLSMESFFFLAWWKLMDASMGNILGVLCDDDDAFIYFVYVCVSSRRSRTCESSLVHSARSCGAWAESRLNVLHVCWPCIYRGNWFSFYRIFNFTFKGFFLAFCRNATGEITYIMI